MTYAMEVVEETWLLILPLYPQWRSGATTNARAACEFSSGLTRPDFAYLVVEAAFADEQPEMDTDGWLMSWEKVADFFFECGT